jgi:hypothetical protein
VVVYRAAPTISVRAMTHPPPVDQLGPGIKKVAVEFAMSCPS